MLTKQGKPANQIIIYPALILLLAIALWLRWRFIQTVQLYPDEFVTLLAIEMIGQKGLPVMPSGLFYEHGLLFSYLGALAALFGPAAVWARYASLLFGLLTLALTFLVGQRYFSPTVGLIAAAGIAIAPAAIHWSGRARMYALLQLLVLLTLWLAFAGISQNKARLRWLALLAYLGATLTHFAAVTLAPSLVLAVVAILWLRHAGGQGSRGAGEQGRRGAGEQRRGGAEARGSRGEFSSAPPSWAKRYYLEILALVAILLLAFLVKRAGQPKGIEALDGGKAMTGIIEVFNIYSDFSFNLAAGWQAIAPFYLSLPAIIFALFAIAAVIVAGWKIGRLVLRRFLSLTKGEVEGLEGWPKTNNLPISPSPHLPTIFLTLILLTTTLEIILLVSPDRRDAKYVFMLLPLLLLLGAQGMAVVGSQLSVISYQLSVISNRSSVISHPPSVISYQLSIIGDAIVRLTFYVLRITHHASHFTPLLLIALILFLTKPDVEALLSNSGDDYETAFAYVKAHWQEGDAIMTGTPVAAALYLGRNDFYGVQKRGGYDYRILTVNGQAVDRWLASPAIRTETALHRTLAAQNVWLVLERWGLQREYYDLPFQQQLLAQTEHQVEAQAQGIFVLRSKAKPQPLAIEPAQPIEAIFGDQVRLLGYTLEPEQPSPGQTARLTLYWQAIAPLAHDYTIFVHLRRSEGGNAAQADHRPLGDLYPTTLWPVGQTIRESSDLTLPLDLRPGDYELWTGLYLFDTGERLPAQNDTSGENAVKLGIVKVLK